MTVMKINAALLLGISVLALSLVQHSFAASAADPWQYSFNDLVLGQTLANGRFAWKPGHIELNDRLVALRTKAWELAQAIKRSHE